MEDIQARVQKAVHESVAKIDIECLRKMQADMHRCSVKCCENTKAGLEETQNCLEKCAIPVNKAQNYLHKELQMFQDRLQRCAMDCQDKIRDKVTANTTEAEANKYRSELEACVVKCGNVHVDMLPGMMKKIQGVLNKGQY
ncbi:protein FAM136A-like [Haliotis asinina]|uniref:protein FAM136A-like n=1 Tax=Haliotis asinina TaxID=109174 RepID=UPI003531FA26